jgi:hypothetical protein
MPQYQGGFYTGQQAAGDVLRQIFEGLRIGRQDGMAARDQRRMELEREQARADRLEQQQYTRGREAKQDEIDEKNRQLARALQLSDLRARGILEGTAPTNPTASIDLRGLGGVGVSALPDPKRYTQMGGFYEDRDNTPMARVKRATARALAGDVEGAVANGMTPEEALQVVNRPGSAGALAAKRADLTLQDEFAAKGDARQFGYNSRLAQQRAENRPAPKMAAVPMKVVEQTLDSEALGSELERLDMMLQTPGGADGVGLIDNLFPTMMVNKGAKQVRSIISNVNSALMKLRSGSAVTPSEAERLKDFTITAWDDEKTMRTKVAELRNFLLTRSRDNREYYSEDNGYKALPAVRSAVPVAQDTTAAAPVQRTTTTQGRPRRNPF